MLNTKFDPQLFFQRAENIALSVPGAEVFSLLRRTLDLPGAWAAMISRRSGEREVVRAGGVIDGTAVDEVLFARTTPVELSWERDGLSSKDGFSCRTRVRLRVSVIPERGELQSFMKHVLGSRRVVQAAALSQYLESALATAAARLASEHDAARLADAASGEEASATIAAALQAPCFAAGLSIEARPVVHIESEGLREVRRSKDEAVRRHAEHEAASDLRKVMARSQAEHLDHLTSMLTRLNEMVKESPGVALPDLIKTFSQQQRGQLYQALFATEPTKSRTRWIVVAAGDEILFFDPEDARSPKRRITVSGAAGPLRSVQAVNNSKESSDAVPGLLLGAATGVYRLPLDHAEPDRTWVVPRSSNVRGGFNAVTQAGDRVFASHSELGVWSWGLDADSTAKMEIEAVTRGAKSVRSVQCFEGDVYCSVDQRVARWPATHDGAATDVRMYAGSLSPITALCVTGDGIFAGNSEGDVLHWALERVNQPERLHTGTNRPVESVWVQAFHGVPRVVFTDTSPYVHARVLGDSFACRFEAGGQTLRRVDVGPDWIVAANELRDRLFGWRGGKPESPAIVLNIGGMCGRSVQDMCLI